MRRVEVAVPGRTPYPVLVGPGARHELAGVLPAGVRRVAVVSQVGINWNVSVPDDVELRHFDVPAGEEAKQLAVVEGLCRDLVHWGFTRRDMVVGVGGGVVTDLAGFVASVYHRGLAVVHVPTTLLGQIDAAIGGKCGVNLPEGKNLVGAIWQPAAVLCDTETLSTLPPREYRAGLGEMAKYAFLGVDGLDAAADGGDALDAAVTACAAHKGTVVAADEREAVDGTAGNGGRALLNYGHTLAHALEIETEFEFRHGEAVAVGLVFAARLAHRLGRISSERVEEHRRLVAGYGLATDVPPGHDPTRLVDLMGNDKKAVDGGLTFILDGPRGCEVVHNVDRETVLDLLLETG